MMKGVFGHTNIVKTNLEITRKIDAFERLEACRKKSLEQWEYEKERTEAMTEKYGDFK